ncbi:hypothetical protein [Psychrobacter sp. N25K4-3-2]
MCELEFTCDTVIALHGADLQATLDFVAVWLSLLTQNASLHRL